MVKYIIIFIELYCHFYLGLINFIVKIFQKLLVFYLLCTIKQLLVFLFFEPLSKKRLNQIVKGDGSCVNFGLDCKRCKHTIM